jgi:hypothetical protein
MNTLLMAFLGATLLSSSVLAHSTPITYHFKVTGGYSGPLEGQTALGSLTFDSSIVPTGGGYLGQMGSFTKLSFTWDGVAYNALTANTGFMDFSSTGALVSVTFGDDCSAGTCRATVGTADWFIGLQAGQPSNFVYGIPGYFSPPGLFQGTAAMPEPDSLALFGIGVVSLLFLVLPKRMSENLYIIDAEGVDPRDPMEAARVPAGSKGNDPG